MLKKIIIKITFEIFIRIRDKDNDTYIHKEFDNLEIPECFVKIDDELYLNFNKIFKSSSTKKKLNLK